MIATDVASGQVKGAERALPADHVDNGLFGQDILSVRQFDRDKLNYIYRVADEMRSLVKRFGKANLLDGKILANLFYEPSTRTSSSFQAAMLRLGGRCISINEVRNDFLTPVSGMRSCGRFGPARLGTTVARSSSSVSENSGSGVEAEWKSP